MADKKYSIGVLFKIVDNLTKPMGRMSKKMQGFRKKLDSSSTAMFRSGRMLTFGLTLPMIGLGVAALNTAGKIESAERSMAILLKSSDKAKFVMKDLRKLTIKTPFKFVEDLIPAAKAISTIPTLNVSEIVPTVKMLGDLAAATGDYSEAMKGLTKAFVTTGAKGKVEMKSIRGFYIRGIPLVQALANAYSKKPEEVFKFMRAGKISFDEFRVALERLTGPGGAFANMAVEMADTFHGKVSITIDKWLFLLESFGKLKLKKAGGALDALGAFMQKITDLPDDKKEGIIKVFAAIAAIGPALIGLAAITKLIAILSSPLGLAMLGAVAVIGTGLYAATTGARVQSGLKSGKLKYKDTTFGERYALFFKQFGDRFSNIFTQTSMTPGKGGLFTTIARSFEESFSTVGAGIEGGALKVYFTSMGVMLKGLDKIVTTMNDLHRKISMGAPIKAAQLTYDFFVIITKIILLAAKVAPKIGNSALGLATGLIWKEQRASLETVNGERKIVVEVLAVDGQNFVRVKGSVNTDWQKHIVENYEQFK